MNTIYLDKYKNEMLEKFADKIDKVEENGNEIHFILKDVNDVPLTCNHVYSILGTRLATIICTDELGIKNGFVLRYVFGKENREDIFIFITAVVSQSLFFPSIALQIPAAALYEREIKEMFGLTPTGNPDTRSLVLHEFPEDIFPLRKEFSLKTKVAKQQRHISTQNHS